VQAKGQPHPVREGEVGVAAGRQGGIERDPSTVDCRVQAGQAVGRSGAVTALSRLLRATTVVWPPAVLLAAPVVLPWILAVAQAPTAADEVRATLIITAVLGLVLRREPYVRASIVNALSKAPTFGAEK
jgi:hypothetical protein